MFNRPKSWYIDVRIFGYGYPFSEKLQHPFHNKHRLALNEEMTLVAVPGKLAM